MFFLIDQHITALEKIIGVKQVSRDPLRMTYPLPPKGDLSKLEKILPYIIMLTYSE